MYVTTAMPFSSCSCKRNACLNLTPAAEWGHTLTVQPSLECRNTISVNEAGSDLFLAAHCGHAEIVEILQRSAEIFVDYVG